MGGTPGSHQCPCATSTSLNISSSTALATFGLSFTSSASVCLLRMHASDGRRSRQFLAFPQSTFPMWKRLATSSCSPWVQFMSLSQCSACSGPNLGEGSQVFNQPTQVSFLDEQSQCNVFRSSSESSPPCHQFGRVVPQYTAREHVGFGSGREQIVFHSDINFC